MPNKSNWMSTLSDNFPIRSLLIPGTHDSAAWKSEVWGAGFVLTQYWNFREQMDNGIRFFDLRLNENLNFFHSSYYLQSNMDDFMSAAKQFLATNPKEGLIIQVKAENCDDRSLFNRNLANLVSKNMSLFIFTYLPEKLKDIRGKIVILLRGEYYKPRILLDYNDNDMFTTTAADKKFIIQDCYCVYDMWRTAEERAKRKAYWITKCFETSKSEQNSWIINFFTHQGLPPSTGIESLAIMIYNSLSFNISNDLHGIMVMDFPNKFNYTDKCLSANIMKDKSYAASLNEDTAAPQEEADFVEPVIL